ncbi:MAG: nitroreductase [Candidatus Heimdallarchaeota archaeon]|nr:nitroreductase [Candidatus Heimdallarchaeota archaeon]
MEFQEIVEKRRSYRSLKPADITEEHIVVLAKTAQLAPSCFNYQPWNFVFVYEEEMLQRLQGTLSTNNVWATNSSMIIAVFSKEDKDCIVKERKYYLFDTGMAVSFLLLKATELGLVAHPIAGFNETKAKEVLNIPKEMRLITLIIVGEHNEDLSGLTEKQRETEKNRPRRKNLDEFVYHNKYVE